MNDRIFVDHAALSEATAALHRAVAQTQARLDQLTHDLAPLQSEWFGTAQQAWVVAEGRWQAAEAEMRHLLADLGTRLGAAQEAYLEADRAGARAFG